LNEEVMIKKERYKNKMKEEKITPIFGPPLAYSFLSY